MVQRRKAHLFVVSVLLASTFIAAQPPSVAVGAPMPLLPIVAGGDRHSLILRSDGILWTFGENFSGQLGTTVNNGNEDPNPVPTQVLTGVKALAAGAYHSMALKVDGTLWTFGDNSCGQLGRATNSGNGNPNPVPTQVMTNVVAIAAGSFHSMALTSDGHLWTFGCNAEGELGTLLNSGTDTPTPTPQDVLSGVGVIAAGAFHSLALKTNNTLWAFGLNQDGQLGDTLTAGDIGDNPIPVQVRTGIATIAAGGFHSLAVTTIGDLLTFGYNYFGELGTTDDNEVPDPPPHATSTSVLSGVAAVAAGTYHSMALKTDGTLWTFGFNFDGELGRLTGINTFSAFPTPTQVLTDVDEIGAGAYHSLVFNNSGELLTFGLNQYGQLGVGTNSGVDLANPDPLTVISPELVPLVPQRLLDSRSPGGTTVDGLFQAIGLRDAGTTTQLQITGRGGVAPVAGAVVLNVTVTGAQAGGYVTVYPCGAPLPNTSNLNYVAGDTIPNLVIAQVGAGGKVCLFTSAATQLIADVTGFFPILPTFESVVPGRLLDTRSPGSATVDGTFQGIGLRAAGSTTQLQVTGRGGVDADAEAVVLNVTVTGAQASGYVTVYPCGSALPNASNINFVAGATIANLVISKIGTGGTVCIFTSAATQLIADVGGFYPNGSSFESLVPGRLLDSRSPGSATVDGQFQGIGLRAAGSTTQLQVTNRGGVPADGGTAVLNITVTGAQGAGFITVYPCGSPQPNASNLNYGVGVTIANLVISKIGTGGNVCIFTSAATHLIADVDGYYSA